VNATPAASNITIAGVPPFAIGTFWSPCHGLARGYRAGMANDIEDARRELDQEFNQFRENLGKIYEKLERVSQAGPIDDISELMKELEDTVGKVRTGGLIGSGAKGHREAREKWLKLQGK